MPSFETNKRLEPLCKVTRLLPVARKMVQCAHLILSTSLQATENSRLVTPPREVVRHGLTSIRAFQDELRTSKLVQRTFVRLMFVGWESAGKTKLNYALQGKSTEYISRTTYGIETASWDPEWAPEGGQAIAFSSWDFAGQQVYYAMHRLFLTERALYLLLVDLSPKDFETTVQRNVRFWLSSLNKHTKGAVVRVIGTKVDLVRDKSGAIDKVEIEKRRRQLLEHIAAEEERVVLALEETKAAQVFGNASIAPGRGATQAVLQMGGVSALREGDGGEVEAEWESQALAVEQSAKRVQLAMDKRPTLPKTPQEILLSSLPLQPAPPADEEKGRTGREPVAEEVEEAAWGQVEVDVEFTPERLERGPRAPVEEEEEEEEGETLLSEADTAYGSNYLLGILQESLLELATAPQHRGKFQLNLPESYVALMEKVEKLKVDGSTAGYLKWDVYKARMLDAETGCGFNSEDNLKEGTRLLHDLGVLLWYYDRPDCPQLADRVFIRPAWVVDLLKPVLGHDLLIQFLPASKDLMGPGWEGKNGEEAENHRRYLIR